MLNFQNSITSQHTSTDVEANFTIHDVLQPSYTPELLRLITQDDSHCQKVVSYYPQMMGRVNFDVKINYTKRSRNEKSTITWINDCLHSLLPWFVEAQTQANIVGKSYLVFDVISDDWSNYPFASNFSLSFPINTNVKQIYGAKVFGCDEVYHTDDNEYIVKRYSKDAINKSFLNEQDVIKWATIKSKLLTYQQDKIKFDIIHKSHVIEFTSFDYQDNREALRISKRRLYVDNPRDTTDVYEGISFRLIRFIRACLRFSSFINATLNRMHRSEAIIYKKDNLGEVNQAIARMVATTSDNNLKVDVTEVIKEELTNIRNSMRNFGVTLIDKKNDIEMMSRSFAGISDLADIFYRDLISASGLTEYGLFGTTSAGSGLAGVDERDKRQDAEVTDNLFANHWNPLLLWLANFLGYSSGLSSEKHILSIETEPSYKISSKELAELVDKKVSTLINLLNAGVIDREAIINIISSNNVLGKNFDIDESDIQRLLNIQNKQDIQTE